MKYACLSSKYAVDQPESDAMFDHAFLAGSFISEGIKTKVP